MDWLDKFNREELKAQGVLENDSKEFALKLNFNCTQYSVRVQCIAWCEVTSMVVTNEKVGSSLHVVSSCKDDDNGLK